MSSARHESSLNDDNLTLRERWGSVTVLIEQKDVLSNAAARRTSLTPSLAAPSSDGAAEQPWNSRASTTSVSNPSTHHAAAAASAANRRQRTSTTMHASLDVPHSLVASLSSQAIVQIQPQLLPLPVARPLVLLIQLEDYIPQELSTTPSSVCFPPNATPTSQSIQRALAPLYSVIARLEAANTAEGANLKEELAIMLYSGNVHLPDEIAIAAFKSGAHGLLTPPFTPHSVKQAISFALERHSHMRTPDSSGIPLPSPGSSSEQTSDHWVEQASNDTPRSTFQAPFSSSATGQRQLRVPRGQSREIQSHEREGFSPMDTSHPILDNMPHHTLAENLGVRGFPHLAGVTERRASVDLGGLALSINSFHQTADAMTADSARDGDSTLEESYWRAVSGSGWAGWDTAPQGSYPFGEQRDTITATTSKRGRSVPAFDTGGELEHANLVLSMYLHSTAALENATLAAFAPNANSMRHQQTLSGSSAFTSSPSASPLSQHHPDGLLFPATTSAPYLPQPLSALSDPSQASPGESPPPVPPSPRNATRLLKLLSSWHFEPYLLSPNDAANCVILMFSTLLSAFNPSSSAIGLTSETTASGDVRVPLTSLRRIRVKEHIVPFVQSLQRLYRKENRYHSFVHALDVFQAVWTFLTHEGRVPLFDEQDVQAQEDWGVRVDNTWRVRAASRLNVSHSGAESKKKKGPSPLSLLNDAELFVLCLATIGHDVGHPGNGNAFLKNAQTPLSTLYEDKSALEKMHCTLLLRLLRGHGMEHLITTQTPEGREGRRLIVGTVLATDMSWHFQWLESFERAMKERRTRTRYAMQIQQAAATSSTRTAAVPSEGGGDDGASETHTDEAPELVLNPSGDGTWTVEPETEETRRRASIVSPHSGDANGGELEDAGEGLFRSPEIADREDRMFLCQAIMKCADISNPSRPHNISRHWSTVLLEEWAAQALLERHLGLPVSVAADANEKVQCVGQISFIKLFTQPLFDTVSAVLDGLSPIAQGCAENRVLWENRLATFNPPPTSTSGDEGAPSSPTTHSPQRIRPIPLALPILLPMARYAKSVFPLSLPKRKKAPLETRRLASMSPWHAVAVPMASGSKATPGGGGRFHLANGSTANTSTSTATNTSSGTSRMWSRSRPESVSSTSTLSSLPGSSSSRGGGADNTKGTGLPRTPTNTTSTMQMGQMRSPVSPLLSPFNASSMGMPFSFGGYSVGGADPGMGQSQGFVPSSVWDVDREVKQRCRMTVHHAWEHRDGRKAQNSLLLEMLGLDGSDAPNSFRARRSSFG